MYYIPYRAVVFSVFLAISVASAQSSEPIEAGAESSTPNSIGSMVHVGGYVDVGAAHVQNDGRGFIFDTGNQFAAMFPGTAWIILGDPWSTAINSRDEPADTRGSFAFQANPVASNGAFTFLVNEAVLNLSATPLPSVFAFVSVDFMPRTGVRGSLGDYFDVDYAYVDWTPFQTWNITFSAGKFDPVFGREYRLRSPVDRPGIVPSLLYRYVGGHPVGLKARGKFFDDRLILNVAVQNSSSMIETMSFSDDVDRNDQKTVSGRISYDVPLPLDGTVELGLSGERGVQGRQTDKSLEEWQWGADLYAEWSRLELRTEFVRGFAPGGGIDSADYLSFHAFDVEAFVRVLPFLGILGRYEQRHAVQRNTDLFAYLIAIQRAVVGVRYDPAPNVAIKFEYLFNMEMAPLPSFPDDVFTSSLVVSF